MDFVLREYRFSKVVNVRSLKKTYEQHKKEKEERQRMKEYERELKDAEKEKREVCFIIFYAKVIGACCLTYDMIMYRKQNAVPRKEKNRKKRMRDVVKSFKRYNFLLLLFNYA